MKMVWRTVVNLVDSPAHKNVEYMLIYVNVPQTSERTDSI